MTSRRTSEVYPLSRVHVEVYLVLFFRFVSHKHVACSKAIDTCTDRALSHEME